jgi:hypothetical protein
MSHGPGRWQRLILQTLQTHEAVELSDLLPPQHTRAVYMALLRAVHRLEDRGIIEVDRYSFALCSHGESHLLLKRPGLLIDRRKLHQDRRSRRLAQQCLSVSKVSPCNDANTYNGVIDVEFERK